MKIIAYDRSAAVNYAQRWAFSRNPAYFDFSALGGDCTSFASQCLFAGCGVMNFTPVLGWFYLSAENRTAAWTGVEYFYRFLIQNATDRLGNGTGPFAEEVDLDRLEIGDFVQFGRSTGDFYHTPIVVGFQGNEPLLAAHSNDAFARPLSSWQFARIRCLHILGARTY
ncbi:MAG: amidase domain-containing protein [Clostridia bacterium]|nr:amidase domain-containing protein [Clostridia bacterium]